MPLPVSSLGFTSNPNTAAASSKEAITPCQIHLTPSPLAQQPLNVAAGHDKHVGIAASVAPAEVLSHLQQGVYLCVLCCVIIFFHLPNVLDGVVPYLGRSASTYRVLTTRVLHVLRPQDGVSFHIHARYSLDVHATTAKWLSPVHSFQQCITGG